MSAKMRAKAKRPATPAKPRFDELTICGQAIVADVDGKLWHVDADSGVVKPVKIIQK